MSALGHKDVGGLDVPMNDAFRVRRVECVGDFDGQRQYSVAVERASCNRRA